jgi:hypothetical protein
MRFPFFVMRSSPSPTEWAALEGITSGDDSAADGDQFGKKNGGKPGRRKSIAVWVGVRALKKRSGMNGTYWEGDSSPNRSR